MFFSPKTPVKNKPRPEGLFINQNLVRMLCCLLGYGFFEGRHSFDNNRSMKTLNTTFIPGTDLVGFRISVALILSSVD